MNAMCELFASFAGNVASICISDLPLCINWCASAVSGMIPMIASMIAPACGYITKTIIPQSVNSITHIINTILGTG